MAKKALGKGLSSIFEDLGTPIYNDDEKSLIHEVPLEKIEANPFQPRKIFDKNEIQELADSMQKNGLLQPILLRAHQGKYQIIAGERRFRAAQLLHQKAITSYLRDKISDREMMELSIIENIHRVQLTPLEEAESYVQLIEKCGYTHETLSEKLSKNRTTITNILRLLKLSEPVKDMLRHGKLTAGHARNLIQYPEARQIKLAEKIINEGLSVRGTESLSKAGKMPKKSHSAKDPHIQKLMEDVKFALGTKVAYSGSTKKGKIEIFYNSTEELLQLTEILKSIEIK